MNTSRGIQIQDLKTLTSIPSKSSSRIQLRRWGYQRLSILNRGDCSVAIRSRELVLAIGWVCSSCDAFGIYSPLKKSLYAFASFEQFVLLKKTSSLFASLEQYSI